MNEGQRRPYREFGAWLRARRLARRWTQEELAQLLSYDVTYLRKIEWGARKATEGFRARLAEVFELPVESLPDSEVAVTRVSRVPTPATSFIGRTGEVEAVSRILGDRGRLVTLVGAPGIGKTRLAIAIAAGLDDSLEHGSCFVPLATVAGPEGVAAAIAHALGLRSGARAIEALLVDHLATQELLLVLDNFEHVVAAAALVARLLEAAPSLRILVTSREALRVSAETEFAVPPLPVSPAANGAVTLFVERARMVRPDFTTTAEDVACVSDICARLDGVPLAIELTAAAARLLTPMELLRDLDHLLDLPTAGPRDAPAHQQTLRAAIDWSYQLLDATERALFARLGVFVGGFTLEAAAAVCAWDRRERPGVIAGVAELARKSLLETRRDAPSGSRLVPLEAIREYALERLDERGETDELRRRHAAYYLELAEEAEPELTGKDQARWLDVLGDEHANLLAALAWTLPAAPPLAVRLAASLFRFWVLRGHVTEGRHWTEQVLALDTRRDRWWVRAQVGAGVLARSQGDYQRAETCFAEAAELARGLEADEELAVAVLNSAIVEENRTRYDAAAARFEESLAIYRRLGNRRGVAHALNGLATVALGCDDFESASALLEQAFAAFRDLEDAWSTALVCTNLGWVAHTGGDTGSAMTWYRRSLALHRSVGHDRGVANALCNMGRVALIEDDLPAATAFLEEALILFRTLGERRGVAECLEELAAAAVADGDLGRAARLYAAAGALRDVIGAPLWPAEGQQQAATLQAVQAGMGEAAFAEACADGRAMSTEDAMALALSRSP